MAKTRNALAILDRVTGDDPKLREMIRNESVNAEVARLVHEARTAAGLTQKELADRIGTKQPVIARIEDADYQGHSLSLLQKIAEALELRVHFAFVRKEKDPREEESGYATYSPLEARP